MSQFSRSDRQLPIGDEIFLDHIAHFVRDPEAASRALVSAGFAPTPVSVQVNPDPEAGVPRPTGTGNVTAMFTRGYIEVLFKTADTPLGREFDAAFARYPGIHLAAFAVADAAKARRRLAASGFRVRPLIEMQRPVTTETGAGTAAFTLARVEPDVMAEGRIQILTHKTEDMVWQKRWLTHPNSVLGVVSLVMAVPDVQEAAARFARFTDRNATTSQFGQTVHLDRGQVELVTPAAFTQLLPEIPIPCLPFVGAYRIAVKSLGIAEGALRRGGLPTRRGGQVLTAAFPQELGTGAWLFLEDESYFPGGPLHRGKPS